ncbi:hypothetical protein GALMADRAFT_102381 [Galerina marginata CBS 339.88]|uniref:GH16 domain-containing protein n=1 Tax=Galerina marginata (strain CBS 339.88) TaxID=685588 RepID=A0A067SLX1_GALM3|nr:hypothetical protein GALMADRAFT_102381 [Galerina marginata CBS 339.88]
MKFSGTLFFSLFGLALSVSVGATYLLKEDIVGPLFYTHFDWQAIDDPTHGRVTYVDQPTSIKQNLTHATFNSFILRADSKTVLSADGPGRNSVRIRSKNTYTTHVANYHYINSFALQPSLVARALFYIPVLCCGYMKPSASENYPFVPNCGGVQLIPSFDVRHMPQGCGTWPAIWETTESGWPAGGETDIVEGVNDQGPNGATLHTTPGCTMPASRAQTGTSAQLNCDTSVNGNAGCGVKFPTANSYGPSFNNNGGGFYAMERSPTYIKVWFWARNDGSVPAEVKNGGSQTNPNNWGTPVAYFPNTSCNLAQHFQANNIIINLTLCGDWAGNVYSQSGCPSTCVDYVNNNPSAFTNAYFNFAAIRVYQ